MFIKQIFAREVKLPGQSSSRANILVLKNIKFSSTETLLSSNSLSTEFSSARQLKTHIELFSIVLDESHEKQM